MKQILTFHALLCCALAMVSCMQESRVLELTPLMTLEKSSIHAQAEPCSDTLTITSNRSWSAVLDPACDWITLSADEHMNLGGSTQSTPFVVNFADNPVKSSRSTTIKITGDGVEELLSLEQDAIVYHMNLLSPSVVDGIDDKGEVVEIAFECNGNWTASVKEGASASVSLSKTEGYRNSKIKATVAAHHDIASTKTATVVISHDDCADVEVVLVQKAAIPYVDTYLPEKTRYVNPEVFSSLGGTRWFNVTSNVKWTASINADETTATGVSLSVSSGDGNMSDFKVTVADFNPAWDEQKKVVIDFLPEGGEVHRHVLTQQKASIIAFEFRDQDNLSKLWPFSNPAVSPASTNKGQGFFATANGLKIGYSASTNCYLYSQGLQCGSQAADYLEMPSIGGHKLIRVTTTDYNGSTKPSIQDAEGNVVKGGEYSTSFGKMTPFTWNLEGTKPGVSYRMLCNTSKTLRINVLELEYE